MHLVVPLNRPLDKTLNLSGTAGSFSSRRGQGLAL